MAAATYLCRVSGVVLMSRVRLTPAVQRALAALPGSIVAATVLPIAARSGPDAIAGIVAGVLTMALVRNEVLALAAGLGVAAGIRLLLPI
ncbi:AzlD domain-containing protein [Enterovirga sp. DB1703]|uniref:AzlD domain-containing protein n=2 Tax=Enterovirga aerilata TaxID=2730920 RepID=A0A849I451_9HYPH|nr:AzlD domain-containing protein [Enterovirga sp. DB1703]NNM74606.1 AzlD domain-containing protein [Enterovirga sp. DB1703]